MNFFYKCFSITLLIFLLNSCATFKTQYKNNSLEQATPDKEIEHSFYLIGDAGNSPIGSESGALSALKKELLNASKSSTVLFLGDNIYQRGLPKKNHENRAFAEHQLNVQTDVVKNFEGNAIFIPGNHDWYSGIKGLRRQEKYVEDILGKNTFLPENGCPLEKVDISEDIALIVIDSEWYLTNWNKHPTINDNCEIKTRSKFFDELEGMIKKAVGKTTLIALHHPLYTNGPHGGQFSFKSHMKPLPVLGTLKNLILKTGGVSPADLQNKRYNTFKKRIVTIAQENEKVIFVSGHEHSLQYLVKDNLPQIVSGAGSKSTATRNVDGVFSSSDPGFARLDVYKDGSSYVRFYSEKANKVIFETAVIAKDKPTSRIKFNDDFPTSAEASIYSQNEIKRTKLFKSIWGQRYRRYYGTKIKAPTVNLDTLFGGLKVLRKGGGHQSKSLQLVDGQGKRYVMRALRKSAIVYLQAIAFKDQYLEGAFDNTYTESLLLDFYTGSHPYAPFVTGALSNAINLYHTNPELYYIPKQNALQGFNDTFGDELYMIEEHVSDGHGNLKSFGYANKIESTDDLLKKIRKDEKYKVDDALFLRARLFDMLIGDWDRHVDQWRWAEFKDNQSGKIIYKPIPRDRDQAFSIMGDGTFMKIATRTVPSLKLMEGYMGAIRNVKGFNSSPYSLDMIILNSTDKKEWDEQVAFIQKNMTTEAIDSAFKTLPKEVQDETVVEIKRILRERLKNLPSDANQYYKVLSKFGVVTGTDKDDWFEIEHLPDGRTRVIGYRIKKGKKGAVFHNRTYSYKDTKEIWVFGLDDDDIFTVFGEGNHLLKVRLIGGQNKDSYDIQNGAKVNIYDYKSKKSEFLTNKGHKKLTDDYKTNTYDYKKLQSNLNQFVPIIGSNPDDGFKIGVSNTYSVYGFERNPFTSQHTFSGSYYFATRGFDATYNSEFANLVGKMNLGINAQLTSSNYAMNFFGYGNSTPNFDNDLGLDFNRVKLQMMKITPSLIWRGELGASFKASILYERVEVEETEGRFINDFIGTTEEIEQSFVGTSVKYHFKNTDSEAFPTLGIMTALEIGYKLNTNDTNRGFGYLMPELGFDYKLVSSGQLVLATKLKAHVNFGDDFEFYQGASIGASDGLRGYRNQRFTGESSFYHNTDIRLNLRKLRTGLLPLNIGFFGGFDYGRVWVDNTLVTSSFLSSDGFNSDKWNTSIGAGFFANAADIVTLQLSFFSSDDGGRFAFGLGFGF